MSWKSTLEQRRVFFSSFVWKDIKSEVEAWLVDIHHQMEVATDVGVWQQLKGNAEFCRNLLLLEEEMTVDEQLQLIEMEEEDGRSEL